ncbi:MAG: hypothetical protein JW956_00780 [Calditrichaceae bacterium]|nr:hypothetical protein [Calditrichaceae bacterium]
MIDFEKLLEETIKQLNEKNYIEFSADQLSKLRLDQAQAIVDEFHGYALLKMPKSEIDFFNWLKVNDRDIWNDIWQDEDDIYLVSIDFLLHFMEGGLGFPICDLVDQPNYWFNARLIKPKGMEELESIIEKLEKGNKISVSEALLLEISTRPTDIWHFCYHHNLQVERLKEVVDDLVYKGFLVHLTDREDLLKYIDI